MTLTWQEFNAPVNGITLDPRFLLPVDFFVDINYVNTVQDIASLQRIANLINDTVTSVLKGRPGCELHVLKWKANRKAIDNPIEDSGETAYFTLEFPNPVFGFALQVGPTTTRIIKGRANIQDIVETIPIFEQLCQRLFVAQNITKLEHSFLDVMGIRDKIYRTVFSFNHQLRLRHYMMEPSRQALNTEVVHKLMKVSFPYPSGGNNLEREFPLAALNVDPIIRGDVTLCFTKTLSSRTRSLWVEVQAPHNVTQQDVELNTSYRTGEGAAKYQEEDLRDWRTPFTDFYRDIILARFMPSLFFGIHVEPRVR